MILIAPDKCMDTVHLGHFTGTTEEGVSVSFFHPFNIAPLDISVKSVFQVLLTFCSNLTTAEEFILFIWLPCEMTL